MQLLRGCMCTLRASLSLNSRRPASIRWQDLSAGCSHCLRPHMKEVNQVSHSSYGRHAALQTRKASSNGSIAPTEEVLRDDGISSMRCTITDVHGDTADGITDALLGFGAQAASVTEYRPAGVEEQEIFDDGGARKLWDRCSVVAYFRVEEDIPEVMRQVQEAVGIPDLKYSIEGIPDEEWVDKIKETYKPLWLEPKLWIVPNTFEPPDPSAVNIIMEPGLAFGTGEHTTTQLCLRHLQSLPLAGTAVLDYGTGTGVLGIGALRMGARIVVGTDTDPLAVKAARRNAALNGLAEDSFRVVQCEPSAEGPDPLDAPEAAGVPRQFDMVVANILQGPLLDLAPRLAGYTAAGGRISLSGILVEQVEAVLRAYSPWYGSLAFKTDGQWALVTGVRLAEQ